MSAPSFGPRGIFVLTFGFLSLLATGHSAALRWDQTEITLQAGPMTESVEGVFTFTNDSAVPVTIAGMHSSCGCTVAELEKNTYAPGESGTIRAVFTIGERIGLQEKTITVSTAAPDRSSTVLALRVDIPKLFEVSPYFVIWNNGEPPTEKTITLRILAPELLAVRSIESRHASFTASIVPAKDSPGHFTITVAPTSTEKVTNGAIHVVLATPEGQTRTVNLYALIRGSSPTLGQRPQPTATAPRTPAVSE